MSNRVLHDCDSVYETAVRPVTSHVLGGTCEVPIHPNTKRVAGLGALARAAFFYNLRV